MAHPTPEDIRSKADQLFSVVAGAHNLIRNDHHGTARAVILDAREMCTDLVKMLNDESVDRP